MALTPGSTIGPYEVTALIGAGGMGEVYRARDTRLHRDVALKLLPDAVAADPERLSRFAREARILAGLDHPHVARVLHTVDEDGRHALVMEYVAGETLEAAIAGGPLSIAATVAALSQVAAALDAAHEQHVIHRDLKPANIKRLPDGSIKVLDFGLAKALAAGDGASASDASTLTADATAIGTMMGTAPYMSPEQVRGRVADRRSDIWAFGCLAYELLTGRRAFDGSSTADIFAAIVGREPAWDRLPPATPAWLARLLRRCLEKDPAARLRDIGDARHELAEGQAGAAASGVSAGSTSRSRWPAGAMVLAALLGGAAAGVWLARARSSPGDSSARPTSAQIVLPSDAQLGLALDHPIAISPDGRRIVTAVASGPLRMRTLDDERLVTLAGTDPARTPFFSPDGRWIGFWQNGSIRKVPVEGGSPITICAARSPLGVTWTSDNRIVLGQGPLGIFAVSADGGEPRALITPDAAKGERSFHGPQVLPGNDLLLFTLLEAGRNWNEAKIVVQSLASGTRTVITNGADARFHPDGWLLFGRDNTVMAARFSLQRLALEGAAVPMIENVRRAPLFESGAYVFSVSDTGTLIYLPLIDIPPRRLVWVNRSGEEEFLPFPARAYVHVRLSPDGRQLAVDDSDLDLWVGDLERATMRRLTTEHTNLHPIWTPDGQGIVFDSTQGGGLHRVRLSGSAPELLLRDPARFMSPASMTPDGRVLAYERSEDYISFDMATVNRDSGGRPVDLMATPFRESGPMISPNGRWLAFVSNETGTDEVYVQAFPGPGGKTVISNGGGREPQWSRNGRELFYRNGTAMMAVPIRAEATVTAGRAVQLFAGAYFREPISAHPVYDVAADGRFLMVKSPQSGPPPPLVVHLTLNWLDSVKARVSR